MGKFCNNFLQKKLFSQNSLNFSYDSLTLYDGNSTTAQMIGKYCGQSTPPSFISSTNAAFLHFLSDGSVALTGFKLEYQPLDGNVTTAGPTGSPSSTAPSGPTEPTGLSTSPTTLDLTGRI